MFRDTEGSEQRISYRELDRKARAMASSLQLFGAPGEPALLLLPPGLDYVVAIYACLYAGVAAVPSYVPRRRDAAAGIATVIEDARAGLAITTRTAIASLDSLPRAFPALLGCRLLFVEDALRAYPDAWQEPAIDPSSVALLQYTSGSTREPRGVIVTHGNLMANLRMLEERMALPRGSEHVCWLPPFHDMGLVGGILETTYFHASTTLIHPLAFLQRPHRWLRAISETGAYVSGGPNFAYDLCVRRVSPEQCEGVDLSRWRVAFVGAEPIQEETLFRFGERFARCGFQMDAFYPCYGLAEATLFVSGGWWRPGAPGVAASQEAAERRHVPCGTPSSGLAVTVVDPETRRRSAEGEVGEIWVSGPSVATGYWEKPEETGRVFEARIEEEGERWLRTGDLGFLRDGVLFVTGRSKDVLIVRGQNVYPQDIEWAAQSGCSALRPGGVAAFEISTEGGTGVVLVAELTRIASREMQAPGAEAARRSTIQRLRAAVAAHRDVELSRVVLVSAGAIPRTSSGKIRRRACRSRYESGELDVLFEG